MKCPQCGKEATEGEKFCKSCGAEVTEVVAVSTEPAVANPAPAQATTQTQNEANGQPSVNVYVNTQQQTATADTAVRFEVSSNDQTLRVIAFALNVLTCVSWGIIGICTFGIGLIPLAWSIPMTVISWGIYKGKKPNSVAFGVCTLIFMGLISGVLLLISKKEK